MLGWRRNGEETHGGRNTRTSSLAVCESVSCASSIATPGAGCAERSSAIGTGRLRAASRFATSTAARLPNEWPKKAKGRPTSSVGRSASMTASHNSSSRVHGGSLHMLLLACRDGGEIREGFLLLVEATLDGKVVVAR